MATGKLSPENGASSPSAVRSSSRTEIDRALAVLTARKDAWAAMDIPSRIALLDQIKRDLPRVEKRWIAAGLAAREAIPDTMAEGEEWYSISVLYRSLRFLRQALQDIIRFGKPRIPGKVTSRPNGQIVAQVVPYDWKERIGLPGFRAEVWMDPSVALQAGGLPQASFYHQQQRQGRVCAVLAAGNVAALVPGDFMHKLFVEGQVVALKMNPVNEYLGPILEDGFAALVKAGFLQILYGGAQEGAYLSAHPQVDSLHLTGSDRTYEALVFGPGAEGGRRKQARQPVFTKPFSAELGNISPVILVPGPWSARDIKNQSARFGSWLVPNSGCYCLTPRLIIQMKNWDHREALNTGIADFLATIPTRKAFYPGSFELHGQFVAAHPESLQLGHPQTGHLPWTFIPDVDPTLSDDVCFQREPFMSLFSETALEANSVVEFIQEAVRFANEKVWGTLVASIVVHPASLKDPAVATAVDQAIADLRYGSIVVNQFGGMAHYMTCTPWGGYPGSQNYDVQSGVGFVNNPFMFDRPQKSVIFTPFAPLADPFLANSTNNHLWLRQDTRYQFNPSVGNLLKLLWRAVTLKQAKAPS